MAAHSVFPPSPYGLRRAGRVQEDQKLWLSASPVGEQALLLYCPLSTVHRPPSTCIYGASRAPTSRGYRRIHFQ